MVLTLRAEPTRLSLRRERSDFGELSRAVERSSQAQDEAATAGSQSDTEVKSGYISVVLMVRRCSPQAVDLTASPASGVDVDR